MSANVDEAQKWIDATSHILFRCVADWDRDLDCPVASLPPDYRKQTYAIAAKCDRFGIDPTPLTDCLRFAERLAAANRVGDDDIARVAFDEFGNAFDRVSPVLNRIIMAAADTAGIEAPEPIKSPGRPPGTKMQFTLDIENALVEGENVDDVATRFKRTPNYVNKIRRKLEAEGKLSRG